MSLRVTTSCSGRFTVFDQAAQLERHGVLHRLVNDYPKWMTRRWGIPDSAVTSLLLNGLLSRGARWMKRSLCKRDRERLERKVHGAFSSRLANYIPADTEVFIGLSSFCLEALQRAHDIGARAIVDHGSYHQRDEREILLAECEHWGLEIDPRTPASWIIEKEQAEFEIADLVLVPSHAARRSLERGGVVSEKIFVNPFGADIDLFGLHERTDHTFRVVQCGGIHPGKGVQYLLQAFAELRLPAAELWFVGSGTEHSTLRPVIERYRSPNIRFTGSVSQQALARIFAQSSVSVLASVAEGFGQVVPQAMACGLPVIVSDAVGAADIVEHERNGFIVPSRDVEALKEKILFFYENPQSRAAFSAAARERIHQECTWHHYGDRLYHQLISSRAEVDLRRSHEYYSCR